MHDNNNQASAAGLTTAGTAGETISNMAISITASQPTLGFSVLSSDEIKKVKAEQGVIINDSNNEQLSDALSAEDLPKGPTPNAKWYHASFHVVCAIIGTGVLGLPRAFAQLTWGPGIALLLMAFCLTYIMGYLVTILSVTEDGRRLSSYQSMCISIIGKKKTTWFVLPFLYAGVVGVNISYLIAAGENINSIYTENCVGCTNVRQMVWTSCIAGIQLLLALFPSLDDLKFMSLLGAVMSIGYCSIAIILSFIIAPSVAPVSYTFAGSTLDAVFQFFMGITTIVFAFNFHFMVPDISATMAEGPVPPKKAMMKGVSLSYVLIFPAYFLSAISGYYCFGNAVDGDVLLSLSAHVTNSAERGAITAAQVMVIIHVTLAYQIFGTVMYKVFENAFVKTTGRPCPRLANYIMRWIYVVCTWFVAILIPFFSSFMSLIGAVSYVPLCYVIPCTLYLIRKNQAGENVKPHIRFGLYAVIFFTCIVGVVGVIASVRQIIVDAGSFQLFK